MQAPTKNPRVSESKIELVEPRLFAATVADEISACINETLSERQWCSVVLAGGKTPAAVYRALSVPPRNEAVNWSKVKLFWGDERWVPHADHQSNFLMVQETLVSRLTHAAPEVHGINTGLASPQAGAKAYAQEILHSCKATGLADLKFDLVLLGMGEDGHTASIFPQAHIPQEQICFAAKNPHDGSERVSLSPQALFSANRIIFMVTGENKSSTLKRVFAREGSLEELPVRYYEPAARRVTWFIDTPAAKELELSA